MSELECSGLCPSVCFCMCASVSHPKCVLSAQVSVLDLGASVEGGSFERRMERGEASKAALQRDG